MTKNQQSRAPQGAQSKGTETMKKAIMTITLVALGYAGAQAWKRAQRTEAQRAIEMMQANWQAGIYPDNLDTIPEGGYADD
jgi:Holliday junction resolvasome RuvABC DNA-binding subunit